MNQPCGAFRFMSDAALVGGPDEFVHLQLKADGERVGNNSFDQFPPGDGGLAGGDFFQRWVLLMRQQWRYPGEKDGTNFGEVVRGELFPGPVVVLGGANDEFDFVGGFEQRHVCPAVALEFAAAGAFQVHDAPHARVHCGDVHGATGFQEDGVPVVAQGFHKGKGVFLEEGFAAGQFDEGKRRIVNSEW